ncbi:hypothetical protein K525DRAFT_253045 [Schizophyllum commune Loenen D]|nr:hypothetical protein K525DRAFT_253045 [Schizophyllum commune Loenen D]
MPSSSVFMADIVRGIPWDLHGAPAILETFDVSLRPDICVAGDQDDFWKDHARGLPKRAISLLSQSIATRVMSMQIERGIEVDFLKLTRRVLSYDCLPAIAYYWLSEGSREMTRNSKDQKRMAFRMLAFFYTLRVQSLSAYDDVFESMFGFLIDQLASRDDHKDFGVGVDSDWLWLLDFDSPKQKTPADSEYQWQTDGVPAVLARCVSDKLLLPGKAWRRSVKNLTSETVRKPPSHDPLALARDASSALVEEAADKTR